MTMTKDERDEFFLKKCPGLVGDMTRQICERAAQPIPSFACAASLALVGALKGSYRRVAEYTTPSNLFFVCLAGTASGKDFPRSAIKRAASRTMKEVGLKTRTFVSDRMRSAQGMTLECARSGGVRVFLHDEAHCFFERANNPADAGTKQVKTQLMELFTKANDDFDPGEVIGKGGALPRLWYPSVSYCGFGVPDGMADIFNERDLKSGWVNRVITLEEIVPPISINARSGGYDVFAKFDFESDPRWHDMFLNADEAAQVRIDAGDSDPCLEFTSVGWSSDGCWCLNDYDGFVLAHQEICQEEGKIDFRGRARECVIRIAATLTDDGALIGEKEFEWARRLVETYIHGIEQSYHEAHSKRHPAVERVERYLKAAGVNGLFKSDLSKKLGNVNANELKNVLAMLKESGAAQERKPPRRAGPGVQAQRVWVHSDFTNQYET